MKKAYAIVNLIVLAGVICWNYVANAISINGNTVASLSNEYYNLFTPAGYAFAIWGVIYLGLIAHVVFQVKRVFMDRQNDEFVLQIGPWLILANVANAGWLYAWLNENTALSVLIMTVILVALFIIIFRLNMERWDAPFPVIAWVWWPFCLYSGWITVAFLANISAYLAKIDWQPPVGEIYWTVILIVIATIINLLMVIFRNMREFAAVGIWALIAIAVRHWSNIPVLQWAALACALILFIAIAIHGYQNRHTNPFKKQIAYSR